MGERRPRDKERKDQEFHMRLSKSKMDLLDILSYEEEKSKAEVLTRALTFYYNYKSGSIEGPII